MVVSRVCCLRIMARGGTCKKVAKEEIANGERE
jgi:hypothetical protein